MEKVVSPGSSLSNIKGRRQRIFKIEDDDEIEKIFDLPAYNENETTVKKKQHSKRTAKKINYPGIRLGLSFPTEVDFDHPYRQLLMALKTKPFLLMAGMCGSGKSLFARTLAYQTCPKYLQENGKPGNFQLIAVQPNWCDNDDIVGWTNHQGIFHITPFIRFLIKAWRYPNVPFVLCLDEMNLARVEQYFADFLSILESRQFINDKLVSDAFISGSHLKDSLQKDPHLWSRLGITLEYDVQRFFLANGIMLPPNLIVVGTANMDESGHQFSMKVLDRIMVVELNGIDFYGGLTGAGTELEFPAIPLSSNYLFGELMQPKEAYDALPTDGDLIISELTAIDNILSESSFRFGYRVRDAALIYCAHSSRLNRGKRSKQWLYTCLDEIILMKILPRISGGYESSQKIVSGLLCFTEKKYPRSFIKLSYMKNRGEDFGLVSFWS